MDTPKEGVAEKGDLETGMAMSYANPPTLRWLLRLRVF